MESGNQKAHKSRRGEKSEYVTESLRGIEMAAYHRTGKGNGETGVVHYSQDKGE